MVYLSLFLPQREIIAYMIKTSSVEGWKSRVSLFIFLGPYGFHSFSLLLWSITVYTAIGVHHSPAIIWFSLNSSYKKGDNWVGISYIAWQTWDRYMNNQPKEELSSLWCSGWKFKVHNRELHNKHWPKVIDDILV